MPQKPKPPADALDVPIDSWTLRCLYNRGKYQALLHSGVLVELRREPSTRSVQVYYGYKTDSGQTLVVKLHWHFREVDGNVIESERDPKALYVERHNAYYHPFPGGSGWRVFRREPEVQFAALWKKLRGDRDGSLVKRVTKAYGTWRKFKCRVFGPIAAHRRRASVSMLKALALSPQ